MYKPVIQKVNPFMFEWEISSFPENFSIGDWTLSQDFYRRDSAWYLKLLCHCDEWIGIFLCKADSGNPQTVTYTIKIKGRTDVAVITKTERFKKIHDSSGERKFLKKKKVRSLLLQESLIIICCLAFDTLRPVEGWELLTSARQNIQAELPDSTSCAIQTEAPDRMSCAIQTEVPDSTSCAIQTEVANNVIEKENSKDEECSLLDMKDDALLRERMKELLAKGSDHDVTISVQDKEFRAHRSILSARSPVFAMMFSHDTKENNTSTINIEDCDPESFDEFLIYVYSGRTLNLTPNNALQLYYPADKYDFPVLKERCVNLLKSSLSVESICDVVLMAAKHQEKELLEVATEFFALNVKKILVTVGWQKFMAQNLVEANELYIKSMEILHPEN